MTDVLVVGGGAAGIVAAATAAQRGARVTLVEKNAGLGMKILISGGGKCNLTHAGSMEEIRRPFRPNEARFLKPAFYRFTNDDFLRILHDRGMRTYARPDGRIFPEEPGNAKDVVRLLTVYVQQSGVRLMTGRAVTALRITEGRVGGVETAEGSIPADTVVLSSGGSSYPATGTTGDGWRWLRDAGHTIVPLRAALAPLYMEAAHPEWSGVALRSPTLRVRSAGKEIARWNGDLLFTHKGLSGPAALGVSREIAELGAGQTAEVFVDLEPAAKFEQIQERLRVMVREPRRMAGSLVPDFVPDRLHGAILAAAGLSPEARCNQLAAKSLNRLAEVLKGWPLGAVRHVPLERGEVVAGGVALDEVDPQTMKSNVVDGLFLCGEILDIAGPVGGYNLQAAWSTGFVAGEATCNTRTRVS